MRAIAEEMQLSAPALYRYYNNKEALLEAIRADGFRYRSSQCDRESVIEKV